MEDLLTETYDTRDVNALMIAHAKLIKQYFYSRISLGLLLFIVGGESLSDGKEATSAFWEWFHTILGVGFLILAAAEALWLFRQRHLLKLANEVLEEVKA